MLQSHVLREQKHNPDNFPPVSRSNMLRRKPTAIAITSEDLATFEQSRLRQLSKETRTEGHASTSSNVNIDPSDELKPLPGDKARIVRSREERIGINRRN
ncbi:anaphase-promoting complex subunit hcn1 [Aspergillus awamori]|uniref:Anaphase-promoting complex subunit hcn1 n=4 Tax=Aspergillus TaxID=5052 RepID=A0A401KZM6_ASPAW|nr:anaphase-promoting complex subunit hcn1 [Aspergillus awamori]